MSMSIDSFLNFCESLVVSYIQWLGDPIAQKQDWSKMEPGLRTIDVIIESFLINCSELLHSETFQAYSNRPACILLKELYTKISTYESNTETMFNSLSQEALLQNPEWISIQNLAQRTQKALELLIKEERPNG